MVDDVPYIADPVEIGQGGFATVYRATDLQADRLVAVKLLSHRPGEVALTSFDRERKALARLSTHPNVVTLHRTGVTTAGVPYLVMEYAPAGTLADRLKSRGRMPWNEAVGWMIPVCDAVEHAHGQGVLHRDLKPQNILVSAHDQPLLSDFGIARLAAGTDTVTGKAKLSLSYASPEQIDGRSLDTATDVYSLGATLYTLLSGAPAFVDHDDSGFLNLAKRILDEPPAALDDGIPAGVRSSVMAAMAKEPSARPTVQQLRAQLAASLDHGGGSSEQVTDVLPVECRSVLGSSTGNDQTAVLPNRPADTGGSKHPAAVASGRWRKPVGAAVVVLLLGAGLAALLLRPGSGADDAASDTASTQPSDATDQGSGDDSEAADTSTSSSSTSSSTTSTTQPDADGDGVGDDIDNCADTDNPEQADTDGDGAGDRCDGDDDGDTVADESDNCPLVANDDQADVDGDGAGDACDDFPDADNDGIIDSEDPCIEEPDDPDTDGDGTPDKCDESPRGMVAVAASAQVTRVTIENQAYGDGETDLFGDLKINDTKVDLPIIPDSREVRPGNWSTGQVEVDPGSPLVRVRVWIRDEDDCLFCRDGLVDLSPGDPQPLHVVIDSATGDVDLSDSSWNRLETIGTLTGPEDGDLSGTITQRGDDDAVHLGSVDLAVTVNRQPAP